MAIAHEAMQRFLLFKVGPCLAITGCIYYFKDFIKYHTQQRVYAWIMNKDGRKINEALQSEKAEISDNLSKLKTRCSRSLSVLEIGAGASPNLHLFPADSEIVCLEPNQHFSKYISTSIKESHFTPSHVRVVHGFAENIEIENERFDAVVCTLVLCNVKNPTKSLSEIKRVLKPGGMLLFLEHVAADEGTNVRTAQRWINPLWRIFADGCEIVRDTGDLIKQAGFSSVEIRKFKSEKWKVPFFIKPCIVGVAVK